MCTFKHTYTQIYIINGHVGLKFFLKYKLSWLHIYSQILSLWYVHCIVLINIQPTARHNPFLGTILKKIKIIFFKYVLIPCLGHMVCRSTWWARLLPSFFLLLNNIPIPTYCCPYTLGYVDIHWSVVDLLAVASLKNTTLPFPAANNCYSHLTAMGGTFSHLPSSCWNFVLLELCMLP